jgi:group I intron endonuclease
MTFPNGKNYIGQTTKPFNSRMSCHKSAAANLEKTDGCRALNSAIRKYGWDTIEKEILENCTSDELDEKEEFYISEYNSISPNGYNLMTGGNSNKTYSDETKALQRAAALKRDTAIYRTKELTKDYPKFLGVFAGNPRITKHPKCSCKTFSNPDNTFEENLEEAKEFLERLNDGEVEVIIPERLLPQGMQKMGKGYRIFTKDKNGKRIIKNFANQSIPLTTRFQQAVEFLETIDN